MDEEEFNRANHHELRRQDERIADFRQFYESFSAEERARIRTWLEKVQALNEESERSMVLKVHTESDDCDEQGNVVRWADCEFSPRSLLMAIKAWDSGKHFTPDSSSPL